MNPRFTRTILASTLSLFVSAVAPADLIDFEDVATPFSANSGLFNVGEVIDGYRGFDWGSNWIGSSIIPAGAAAAFLNNGTVPSGYQTAIANGTRAMYTPGSFEQSPCLVTMSRSETWNFNSVDIGTAWRTGVLVEITGLLSGSTIYSYSFTIGAAGVLSTLSLNFTGIDTLRIRSSGGTAAYSDGDGAHLILDNLSYSVPAPGALALLALSGGVRRRRR
jgi:hypothetical protein